MIDSTTIDRNCNEKHYFYASDAMRVLMEITGVRWEPPPPLLIIDGTGDIVLNPAAYRVPSYAKKVFFPSIKVEKINVQDKPYGIKYTDYHETTEVLSPGHRSGELRIRSIPSTLTMHLADIQKRRGYGNYTI